MIRAHKKLVALIGLMVSSVVVLSVVSNTASHRAIGASQPTLSSPESYFQALRGPAVDSAEVARVNGIASAQLPESYGGVDPEKTRWAGSADGQDVLVLAGPQIVCLASIDTTLGSGGLTLGCSALRSVLSGQLLTLSGQRPDGSVGVQALVPDTVRSVQITDAATGGARAVPIQNSIAATTTQMEKPALAFTNDDGREDSIAIPAAAPSRGP